jgi:hypothetical protein
MMIVRATSPQEQKVAADRALPLRYKIAPFDKAKWNPRYLAYMRAHGFTDPDAMLEADRERWPGGVMCGFTLWIREQWNAWEATLSPQERKRTHDLRDERDHVAFDTFIGAS